MCNLRFCKAYTSPIRANEQDMQNSSSLTGDLDLGMGASNSKVMGAWSPNMRDSTPRNLPNGNQEKEIALELAMFASLQV